MDSVRRSVALSYAQKYSVMVVQFIATVVLARILTPAEIGLYSVSIGFVAMAHTLRDFGVSNYLLQERELTAEKIRSAYGVRFDPLGKGVPWDQR